MNKLISKNTSQTLKSFGKVLLGLLIESLKTWLNLLKVIVPVLILTKILVELGAVAYIGRYLSPVMGIVGLPGSTGLVWAAGLLVNPFLAVIMLGEISATTALTVAQVTILGNMILVAHVLPLELSIAKKAGMRLPFAFIWRFGGAFILGFLLNQFYRLTGWLQTPNHVILNLAPPNASLLSWTWGQVQSLLLMLALIFLLVSLLRLLEKLGLNAFLTRYLKPFLKFIGMSENAMPIIIVGMLLGLAVGGGLIVAETKTGKMSRREVFYALALMNLFHSLIDDTLVVTLMGCSFSGIIWARLLFTLILVFILVRITIRFPDTLLEKFLYQKAEAVNPVIVKNTI
jgi:hypothetical protein